MLLAQEMSSLTAKALQMKAFTDTLALIFKKHGQNAACSLKEKELFTHTPIRHNTVTTDR